MMVEVADGGGGAGITQMFGSNIYTILYRKEINNQDGLKHRELYLVFCNYACGERI